MFTRMRKALGIGEGSMTGVESRSHVLKWILSLSGESYVSFLQEQELLN